jgi:hypothetical protein
MRERHNPRGPINTTKDNIVKSKSQSYSITKLNPPSPYFALSSPFLYYLYECTIFICSLNHSLHFSLSSSHTSYHFPDFIPSRINRVKAVSLLQQMKFIWNISITSSKTLDPSSKRNIVMQW